MFEPWKTDPDFTQNYLILIAVKSLWVKQIFLQLDELGIPHISSDAYTAALLWERTKNIGRLLEDDYSRTAYFGLAWYWLTHDISLLQHSSEQYFEIPPFSYPLSEVVADIGAYVGDTTEEYIRRSFGKIKVYAFEPDDSNLKCLELRVNRLKSEWHINDSDIIIILVGVADETKNVFFCNEEFSAASYLSDLGTKYVNIFSLDDYFKDKQLPTVIKADIEGAEKDMIRGAKKIIKELKPKMAICIYHKSDDFVKITEMINYLNPEYNFSVRTHSPNYEDTVLYCY